MNTSTEIIPRTTLVQLCAAWTQSANELRQAFDLLNSAKTRLKTVFGEEHYRFSFDVTTNSNGNRTCDNADELLAKLKKDVWRILIDRMELRRVLSINRAAELDKQLETGNGLPEIEEVQIMAMLEGTLNQVHVFIEEMVKEVFDYLRPGGWQRNKYVSNQNNQFGLQGRVVLSYAVERWGHDHYRVNYHRQQNIRSIDNVFHALDGKGTVKSYSGELIEAIDKCPVAVGHGETTYFKFKCFRNGNLHLDFKRDDLLTKLNKVAGGMSLKQETPIAA